MATGLIVLFFVLQGLVASGLSIAHSGHRTGEAGFAISLQNVDCAVDEHGDRGLPLQKRAHAQCCVLCGGRHFDGAALLVVGRLCAPTAPPPVPEAIEREAAGAPRQFASGWASSWSSQAPPIAS